MKSQKETWIALFVAAVGLLLAAILGLFAYVSATATPLHPDPKAVPSVTHGALSRQWAGAVEQGRQIVRTAITEQNLPGLSVAVGAGGDLVWAEGFGWADLENRAPVAPQTRFRIGTASVALTSAAVGLLLEKGRLKLDDEIQKYVPAFPVKQWPVTLRQLMGHLGGVRHYRGEEDYMPSAHCERALEGVQKFAVEPLRFEPGTQFRYSTYGWVLVSAAVEAAANQPFSAFMRSQIFEPLGMGDTTTDSPKEPIPDRATFYFPRFNEDTHYGPEVATEVDYSCFAGAGAFLSTPSDLVQFGIAVSNGKLLKPDTIGMLQRPQRLTSGEQNSYGLGWDLETVPLAGEPTRVAGCGRPLLAEAVMLGGSTSLLVFPERGLVVSVTSNISFADPSAVALRIAEAFAEQEKSPARR
jgi:serine beta-lactamase-like protein LACTB